MTKKKQLSNDVVDAVSAILLIAIAVSAAVYYLVSLPS